MKITDQQLKVAVEAWLHGPVETRLAIRAAIESIPSPLPTLRPIAEMPAEVPEGCLTIGWTEKYGFRFSGVAKSDTHFTFILLPVESEEDKMRAEFEAAYKAKYPQASLSREPNGDYFSDAASYSWDGFKLAKSTPETK